LERTGVVVFAVVAVRRQPLETFNWFYF